jgi:hypothetical protein
MEKQLSERVFEVAVGSEQIIVQAVHTFNRKVQRLNKRAKLDLAFAEYTVAPGVSQDGTRKYTVRFEAAVVGGYKIAAVITLTDSGYLASRVAGTSKSDVEDVLAFTERGGECDHCRALRRRKTTYVLRGISEGARKLSVVGSSCIEEFIGPSAPALGDYAEMLSGLENEMNEAASQASMNPERAASLSEYLAYVHMNVRTHGWRSKKSAIATGGPTTAGEAWKALVRRRKVSADFKGMSESGVPERDVETGDLAPEILAMERAEAPSEQDLMRAEADLFLAEGVLFEEHRVLNEYESALFAVVKQGFAFGRNMGLAASIYAYCVRRRGTERAAKATKVLNEHVGVVGERSTHRVLVQKISELPGYMGGSTWLHVMLDEAGHKLKWFATREKLDEGRWYEITGSVKSHGEYQGLKETQLTRCKAVKFEWPGRAAVVESAESEENEVEGPLAGGEGPESAGEEMEASGDGLGATGDGPRATESLRTWTVEVKGAGAPFGYAILESPGGKFDVVVCSLFDVFEINGDFFTIDGGELSTGLTYENAWQAAHVHANARCPKGSTSPILDFILTPVVGMKASYPSPISKSAPARVGSVTGVKKDETTGEVFVFIDGGATWKPWVKCLEARSRP